MLIAAIFLGAIVGAAASARNGWSAIAPGAVVGAFIGMLAFIPASLFL